MARKEASGLTAKQERFCREYVIDLNGAQAAKRAGYSETAANVRAAKLMANPLVAARVKELTQTIADKLGLTAEYVLRGLMATAESCNAIVVTGDPTKIAGAAAGANRSHELLGKYLGIFVDKSNMELSGPDGAPLSVQVVKRYDKGHDTAAVEAGAQSA